MPNRSVPREWRDLADTAEDQGWRIEVGGKHLKWIAPDGGVVFTSVSPSDVRARKNHISIMKRYGYKP